MARALPMANTAAGRKEARYELIDGVAYAMAPAPSRRHQEVLGKLFHQVTNPLEDHPCRTLASKPKAVASVHSEKAGHGSRSFHPLGWLFAMTHRPGLSRMTGVG